MQQIDSSTALPPRVGALLTEITETPDFDTALWKMLLEYMALKIEHLKQQIKAFEAKWGMGFEAFSERMASSGLDSGAYTYEIERDFWEWEKAETLLRHYEALQSRWM